MRIAFFLALAALASGCVQSARIEFYRPMGSGKVVKDNRNVPRKMKYVLGGSEVTVSADRSPDKTEITIFTVLSAPATFAIPPNSIPVTCDHSSGSLVPGIWKEWRIKDGIGYHIEHEPSARLTGRDFDSSRKRAPRGDVSTGHYWLSMTMNGCTDKTFTFQLPLVRMDDASYELGEISMAPEVRRFTWTVPIQ